MREAVKDSWDLRGDLVGCAEPGLPRWLASARRNAGLSRQQLAVRAGVSQADISSFESRHGNLTARDFVRLAMALHHRIVLVDRCTASVTGTR